MVEHNHVIELCWVTVGCTLLSTIEEEIENATKECIDQDMHYLKVDAKVVLQSFDVFIDRAIILLFTRKLHK